VGDSDVNPWEDLYLKQVCGATGCDGGSPQQFNYRYEDAGYTDKGTGTITMEGSVDNDGDMTNAMLDQIMHALTASADCTTVEAQKCMNTYKRESPGQALDCQPMSL
jgi:hypothetical protein